MRGTVTMAAEGAGDLMHTRRVGFGSRHQLKRSLINASRVNESPLGLCLPWS